MNKNGKKPEAVYENIPLTAFQEQIYIESSRCGSASYNMPRAYLITGKLDVSCLNISFLEVLKKNPFLRARLIVDSAVHSFGVISDKPYSMEYFDLSFSAEPLKKALEIYSLEESIPIDILGWPLFRVKLMKVSISSFLIVFNFHHIIFDVRSWAILLNELEIEYNSLVGNNLTRNQMITSDKWQDSPDLESMDARDFSPTVSDMTCQTTLLKWKHLTDVREAKCKGRELNWKLTGNDLKAFLERIKKLRLFTSSALMCAYSWTIFDFIENNSTIINLLIPSGVDKADQIGCFLKSVDMNIEKTPSCIGVEDLLRFQKNFIQACEADNDENINISKKPSGVESKNSPLGFDYYLEVEGNPIKFSNLCIERVYTKTKTTKRYLTLSVKYFPREAYMNFRFEYSESVFDSVIMNNLKDNFMMHLHSIINV